MRELVWILGWRRRVDRAAPLVDQRVASVRLADAGEYEGAWWHPVDDGDPLLAAIGMDPETLERAEVEPEIARELAGRVLLREQHGGGVRYSNWGRGAGPRPLLLVDTPCQRPWGARALEGPSGERLAHLVFALGPWGLASLLASFEAVNTLDAPGGAVEAARRAAERHAVVVGRDAWNRLAEEAGATRIKAPPTDRELASLREALEARSLRYIAHPSGRATSINSPWARDAVARVMLAAALDARGLPTTEDADLRRAFEAGEVPRWCAWRRFAATGLTSPGPHPLAAWYEVQLGREHGWLIAQLGLTAIAGAFARMYGPDRALVMWPRDEASPGREYVGVLAERGKPPAFEGTAEGLQATALLLAIEARRLRWLDPWDTRNVALAGVE